jgi:spermidine synthase
MSPAPSTSRAKSKARRARKTAPPRDPKVEAHHPRSKDVPAPFLVMLFCSGLAGITYQVLWIRELSLAVGVEVFSITIAVSAFFAGLAAGSVILGRFADRWKRPLVLYCLLEVGIACAGVATTFVLAHAAAPFVALQGRAGILAWALPFLLVSIPAFLMGGTLPAAIRWQTRRNAHVAEAGGWAYAANTAGGIAGALLCSFVFVPWLGVRGTALAGASINLAAAAMAMVLERSMSGSTQDRHGTEIATSPTRSRTALILYAVSGCIALGYEVLWSQAMTQFLSTRVFAFSAMLATYLAGLVVGSALYVRYAHRIRDTWGVFGVLIASTGVIALLEILGLGPWQLRFQFSAGNLAYAATGSESARMYTRFAIAALGIVFVPTILLGAAFPVVLRLAADARQAGRDVGAVLALNTAGGIVGTLLTGFLLIPVLGLVRTLTLLATAAACVGAYAVQMGTKVSNRMRWAVWSLGVVSLAAGLLCPQDRLARLLLATRGGGKLVFYQEGRGATVAVAEQSSGDHVFRRLYIQGVSNSGDAMPSLRYMRLQAMLPLLIHRGEPRSALVIGFGTGITAGALLRYSGLRTRVCVELLPQVVRAGYLFPENYGAGTDPRLQIHVGDGRQELLRNPARYDLITLEPPPPSAEGVVNLYSSDFYRIAVRRLTPDGLFAQWLPLATQNDEDTRSLVRSFLDVFPYATLWTTELHEMLLVGSPSPIELNVPEIARRFRQDSIRIPLSAVGVASPAALLATWVTGRDGLEKYSARAQPVTDDDPRIEYSTWVRPKEITRTLPVLLGFESKPPLIDADDLTLAETAKQGATLLNFYQAGVAAYNGDRNGWQEAMEYVIAHDQTNSYYNWLAGADR